MATATNGSTPTQARTRPDVNGSRPMPTPPRVAPPRGRRRPGLLALGVALVAVGALTAAWLVSTAGQRSPVVVVLRDVPYGAVLTSGDVGSADVSVDANVATIPASQLDSVVGSVAATSLSSGTLLSRSQLTTSSPPGPGQVLVAVAVPANRMPAGGLAPGDRVLVVSTPATDADPSASAPETIPATVVRVGGVDVNGIAVLDVTAATADGPTLAARSATGRIALVVQPRSGS